MSKTMAFVSMLPVALAKIDAAEVARLKQAANAARNITVKNLSGSRSGIQYRVPGTKRMYTASAPGEYPATRLGELKGSVHWKLRGNALTGHDAILGTPLEYGAHLEKKHPMHGGREWLRPSLEQARPTVKTILGARWF